MFALPRGRMRCYSSPYHAQTLLIRPCRLIFFTPFDNIMIFVNNADVVAKQEQYEQRKKAKACDYDKPIG